MTNPFLPRQSRRELDSVVATQAVLPGQPLGALHYGFRRRHTHKIRPISSEIGTPRSASATRTRESRARRGRCWELSGARRLGRDLTGPPALGSA